MMAGERLEAYSRVILRLKFSNVIPNPIAIFLSFSTWVKEKNNRFDCLLLVLFNSPTCILYYKLLKWRRDMKIERAFFVNQLECAHYSYVKRVGRWKTNTLTHPPFGSQCTRLRSWVHQCRLIGNMLRHQIHSPPRTPITRRVVK